MKIEVLEKENGDLLSLTKEMNEFKQTLESPLIDIDQRRYHLLKSQVIQLTRSVTFPSLFLQNKILRDTVEHQSTLIRETERIINYLDESVMLSSKKAEIIYQKRRERLLEKRRKEELMRQHQFEAMKKRKRNSQAASEGAPKVPLKLYEMEIAEY